MLQGLHKVMRLSVLGDCTHLAGHVVVEYQS